MSKLREVAVYYDRGGKNGTPCMICTNMAAHVTDEEIKEYYAVGRVFNIGVFGFDLMAKVVKIEILA